MSDDRDRLPLEYATRSSHQRGRSEPPRPSRVKFLVLWITGQLWLLIALALFLGQTFERSSPTRYSAFGLGSWFSDGQLSRDGAGVRRHRNRHVGDRLAGRERRLSGGR